MPTMPIFQTGLYFTHLNLDNNCIKQHCKKFSLLESVDISNRGGIQTPKIDVKVLDNLHIEILNHAHIFCDDLGMKPRKLNITDCWINVNQKNNWNFPHNHLGSGAIISGVYYVTADKDCGDITFLNPDNSFNSIFNETGSHEFFTPYNSSRWSVEPKQGKLILFPASLFHLVEPSQSEQERISVSFNIYFEKD